MNSVQTKSQNSYNKVKQILLIVIYNLRLICMMNFMRLTRATHKNLDDENHAIVQASKRAG
ncbi:hypothetical protein HMPREF9231_0341 [Gardnerella vaginalis HMP9231]|nr:hypothetical protein HMPREF9231_0341 [Gardnerella vaginalis HMP9231]BAQ33647.1 hypothetical protein GAVG_0995 [Gardnerella vaginalis ATCC 14018 = JCM 11026]